MVVDTDFTLAGGSLPPPPQGALSSLQQRSTQEVEERRAELKQTRERLHKEIDGAFDYICVLACDVLLVYADNSTQRCSFCVFMLCVNLER